MALYVDEEELWERVTEKKRPTRRDDFPSELFSLLKKLAYVPEPKSRLEKRVESLENEVRKLKGILMPKRRITKADSIYEKFREELEKEHFGKIVAIDIDSETVVGIGNTVLEAYNEGRKKSSRTKFSYKRVGYPYVYRL